MKKKTLAIPIRTVNWSDTSQVLTLFTRDFGTVEAIAKGAHRARNPFQGPFDLAVLWEVVFAERPPERGLAILTEGAVLEGFRGLRERWSSWAAAAFVLEYLRAVGTAGEPSREVFDAALTALSAIGGPGGRSEGQEETPGERRIASALITFEARSLRVLGWSAPITSCTECGRPWSGSDRPVFFSAGSGGILCASCRGREPSRPGILVPGSAVRALEALAARPACPWPLAASGAPSGTGPPGGDIDRGSLAHLSMITKELRVFSLEHDFKMIKYIANFFLNAFRPSC